MGASDFLLTLNWAFGLSSGTRSAMKEAKLGMTDMHELMKKQNKLYDDQGLKAENFYNELTEHANKHFEDRKRQENELVELARDKYQKMMNAGTTHGTAIKKIYGELKDEYKDLEGFNKNLMRSVLEGKTEEIGLVRSLANQYRGLQESLDKYYKIDKLGGVEQRQARAMSLHSGEQIRKQIDEITKGMVASGQITEETTGKMSDNLLKVAINARDPIGAIGNINKAVERLNSTEVGSAEYRRAAVQVGKLSKNLDELDSSSVEKASQNIEKVARKGEVAADRMKELGDSFKTMGQKIKNLVEGPWSTFLGALALSASVQDAAAAQTEITADIARLNLQAYNEQGQAMSGLADKQNAYMESMLKVGSATSTKLSEVQDVMNSLARARVGNTRKELEGLAEVGLQMEYAFGLSRGASTDLLRNLRLVGGLGQQEIENVGDAMAGVQSSIGLTSEEATEAAATIGHVVNQMNAMGGAARNIDVVAREVSKMTAEFNQAGLSAQDASQMINKLMDPSQIEENALLYNKLGMSVSDAMDMMAGGGEQMSGMAEKMRELAYDLREQYAGNPRVLQQMAKLHGMDLQTVGKLANKHEEILGMSMEQRKAMEEEASLNEQMQKAREGINEELKKAGAQLNIVLLELILPIAQAASKIVGKIADGVQAFTAWKKNLNGSYDWLKKLVDATDSFVLLFVLLGGPIIGKVLSGFGGIFKVLGTIVSGPMGWISKGFGTIKDKIFGVKKAAASFGDNLAQQNQMLEKQKGLQDAKTNKIKAMAKAFQGMQPAQLLAIGAAIMLIGVGVGVIVYSLSKLAAVMKDMDPMQIITFLIGSGAMVIGILFGMSLAIKAIGAASLASWPQLLAVGVAIMLIGAGVGIIIYSLSLLVTVVAEAGATFGQLAGIGLMLALTLGTLGAVLYFVGPAFASASIGMIAFGFGILMVAAGVAMIIFSIGYLIDKVSQLGTEALPLVIQLISQLGLTIIQFSIAAMGFAAAMILMASSSIGFITAALGLTAIVGIFWLLGKATSSLSENIMGMGTGMKLISENAEATKEAIAQLKEAMSNFNVPEGFNKIGKSFAILGLFAKMFGKDIEKVGNSIFNLGEGLKNMSIHSEKIGDNLSKIKDNINTLPEAFSKLENMNIEKIKSLFIQLGEATNQVAANFDIMGKGIDLMARGLSVVVQQLEKMLGVLSSGDLTGLLDNFNVKMNEINNNMTPPQQAGPGVQNIVEMDRQRETALKSANGQQPGANNEVVGELRIANTWLEQIDTKMGRVVDIISSNGGDNRVTSKTSVNVNGEGIS